MDPSVFTYCQFIISDDVDVKDFSVLEQITDAGFAINHLHPLQIECKNPSIAQLNKLSSFLHLHIERREDDFSIIEDMDGFEEKPSKRTHVITDKYITEKTQLDDCNRHESQISVRQSDCARSKSYDDLSDNFQELSSHPKDAKIYDKFPSENLEIVNLNSKHRVCSQVCVESKVKEDLRPLHFAAEHGKQETVETRLKSSVNHDEEQRDGKLFMENPITHDKVGSAKSSESKVTTSTRAALDQVQSNYATHQIDEVSNLRDLKNSQGKSEDHSVQNASTGSLKPLISHDEGHRDGKLSMESPITHDIVGSARRSDSKVTTSTRAAVDQVQSNYATHEMDEVSNLRDSKNSQGKFEDLGVQKAVIRDHLFHGSPSLGMNDEENGQCHFGVKTEQNEAPSEGRKKFSRQVYSETHSSDSFAVSTGGQDKTVAGTDNIITSLNVREKPKCGIIKNSLQQGKQSNCLSGEKNCDYSRAEIFENLIILSPSTYKYANHCFVGTTLEDLLNQAKNLGSQFVINRQNYQEGHQDFELLQKFCVNRIYYDEEGKDINDAVKVLRTSDLYYEMLKGCIILAGHEDDVKAVKIKLSSFLGNQPMINRCSSERLSKSGRIDYAHGSRREGEGEGDRINASRSSILNPKHTEQELVSPSARPKDRGPLHRSLNQSDWPVEVIGGVSSYSYKSSATKVAVLQADITTLQVDCIVNAANRKLKNFGGVAQVIATAAGRALQHECDAFIYAGNTLDVGDVFVSTGGRLPSKKVLHAVGPRWKETQSAMQFAKLLRRTVIRCLMKAQLLGMKSVALPSISAAFFKVPKEMCAESYLKAAKHFLVLQEIMQAQTPNEIIFVDIAPDMVNLIQRYFDYFWKQPIFNDEINDDHEFIMCLLHKQDNINI